MQIDARKRISPSLYTFGLMVKSWNLIIYSAEALLPNRLILL